MEKLAQVQQLVKGPDNEFDYFKQGYDRDAQVQRQCTAQTGKEGRKAVILWQLCDAGDGFRVEKDLEEEIYAVDQHVHDDLTLPGPEESLL